MTAMERSRRIRCVVQRIALIGLLGSATACDHAASLLAENGVTGSRETALGWFLLITSCVVISIVTALVMIAALKRRHPPGGAPSTASAIEAPREVEENRWITTFAIIIPALVLTASFLFTVSTLNAVGAPSDGDPATTVIVTGHQWWWELTYDDSTGQEFTAANEIHVPVGRPVRFKLQTADVIHSFWVPQLAGKMDIIPGQNNTTWLEARTPGVFAGPCGEYCGDQHAQMRLTVVADAPETYARWVATQRQPAASSSDPQISLGRTTFMTAGCAACHTIRGTAAGGNVGPDLTHLASRRMLAAGALPNTAGNLMGWIDDPQAIKPGADMPRMAVPPARMAALVAYLETLK